MAAMASLEDARFDREEGVLKDVLDELDRERSRRAELEDQVRKLQEDAAANALGRQAAQTSESAQNNVISQRIFVSMETQLKGFQQIVDALTLGKPAIAAAAANERAEKARNTTTPTRQPVRTGHADDLRSRKTLPLHVVRLLEVLPWDPRAKQHIFAVEEIYEWQIYRESSWQHQLKFFPMVFKTLPLIKAESSSTSQEDDADMISYNLLSGTNGATKEGRSFLSFLAGSEAMSSKQRLNNRIFTNGRLTAMFNLENGYPLPKNDDCVWEWVGGWRIGARGAPVPSSSMDSSNFATLDSGKDGWSYALSPGDFLLGLPDVIWDNDGAAMDGINVVSSHSHGKGSAAIAPVPVRTFRRRRWMRQRVLVDYLHASTATKHFLEVLCYNARLSAAAGKVFDQLVETKVALTEAEEKLSLLNDAMHRKDALLKEAGIADNDWDSRTLDEANGFSNLKLGDVLNGSLQAGSDLELKPSEDTTLSQEQRAISARSADGERLEGSLRLEQKGTSTTGSVNDSEKFDWKKIGRGAILNKLKPPGL